MSKIIPEIANYQDEMTRWRRDIHAHPELGFEENRTSDMVAELLQEFGMEVYRGIGKTGLVGTLRSGNSTRAIGLRADMDALPIQEANEFEHRSRHDGTMHACGHDGHTTMLLGAAKYLAASKNFDGAVHFIFQPAEEGLGGAKAMVEDGLFTQFPMEAVFGMHNRPGLAVGKFAIRPGAMMAGGALFDLVITGRGAHGARPEAGIDPVVIGAQIISAWQTIISRNTSALDTAVLTVSAMHAGEAYNVVPNSAHLKGTVRAFSKDVMAAIESKMAAIAKGIAEGMGATTEFSFNNAFLPLVNTPEEALFAGDIAAELVGEENIERNRSLIMASEDFSFMLDACPGAYINIGNGDVEGSCEVHNPGYDFNDAALGLGASFFARVVESKLAKDRE